MSECMAADKPQISILMAVYNPNLQWLREQLASLNAQTYPNLRLYVRDDCSPGVPFDTVRQYVEECITAFPWELRRSERNLGPTGTFERLTEEADGAYFAYCDQDDVWLPEKLTVLQETLEAEQAAIVCSDMDIIDGSGVCTAGSICQVRRHHVFRAGNGLAGGLLFHNFVTGCTMMVRAEQARAALPFCPYMYHDHYLALYCAEHGSVAVAPGKLIHYRIHGGNETSLMTGITDKESYYRRRILDFLHRLEWLRENMDCGEPLREEMDRGLLWLRARERNWRHRGGRGTIWKYRSFSLLPSLYEIFGSWFPEPLFRLFILAAQRNMV